MLRPALVALALLAPAPAAAGPIGGQQSPIDIRSEDTSFTPLPALQFAYGSAVTLDVFNTGSPGEEATVRANVGAGAGRLTVGGVAYDLIQFHFHTEAEHLVNGHQAAMELHLVHQAADGTLLVVGRFIEPGPADAALGPIFSALPPTPGSPHLAVDSFDLASLLPDDRSSFRYPGSLTTSPYDEGVRWVVLAAPLTLSQVQIDAFRALFPDGDSRHVQDLNGRVVLTDVTGFAAVPEPGTLAAFGLAVAGLAGAYRRGRVGAAG